MFELHYEPLERSENLKRWEIAVIPWDTETFGFGVYVLKARPDAGDIGNEAGALEAALNACAQSRQAPMIIASVPAEQTELSFLLQRAGFNLIDIALGIRYENLDNLCAPPAGNLSLRPAAASEMNTLVEIAGVSFRHGRYHMDPDFSASLADQRYRDWIRRCFDPANPQQILTALSDEAICGFSVVECTGTEGYLNLHAIDPQCQGKKLGTRLIAESLRYLHNRGANSAGTKISASNLQAMNMHFHLKGRFATAERLFHRHQRKQSGDGFPAAPGSNVK
jgi:GNAT superfamily N-acetyltransferase